MSGKKPDIHPLTSFLTTLPFPAFAFRRDQNSLLLEVCNPLGFQLEENHSLKENHPIQDCFAFLKADGTMDRLLQAVNQGETFQQEFVQFQKFTQEFFLYQIKCYFFSDTLLLVFFEDLTHLWRSKQAIEEKERYLEHLMQTMLNGVVVINLEGQITYANESATSILSLKREEILNRYYSSKLWKQIKEDGSPLAPSELPLAIALQTGSPVYQMEHGIVDEGGRIRWLNVNANPLKSPDGNLIGATASFLDITEAKNNVLKIKEQSQKNWEALQKAERMNQISGIQNARLQNFTHIVSHDMRQHTANFEALLEVLSESTSIDERREIEHLLKYSAKKLSDTISHLNEMLQISQHLNEPFETVFLLAEMQKQKEFFQLEEEQAVWMYEISPTLQIRTIYSYLHSILFNLISNAIKYKHPSRQAILKIQARSLPSHLELDIEDNGLGIDLEKYGDKLFGMYRTFHNNSNARGVGLFFTKAQVEVLGGEISVQSSLGSGSTFRLRLPWEPESSIRL